MNKTTPNPPYGQLIAEHPLTVGLPLPTGPALYRPCPVCGAETGVGPLDQCEHVCPGCEGTGMELNGWPCLECGGTQLRRQHRNPARPQP